METCGEASGDMVPAFECRDLQDNLIIMWHYERKDLHH